MPEHEIYTRCPSHDGRTGPRCDLPTGHRGLHAAHVLWGDALSDDAPTAKLPPIRDTVRRRPPAPEVRELTDRAELLETMVRELLRELHELRAGEDQANKLPDACGSIHDSGDGVEWVCGREAGHEGAHGVHGRWWL